MVVVRSRRWDDTDILITRHNLNNLKVELVDLTSDDQFKDFCVSTKVASSPLLKKGK